MDHYRQFGSGKVLFNTNIVVDEIPRVATNNCESNCGYLLCDATTIEEVNMDVLVKV